jgi:hypothetical protein
VRFAWKKYLCSVLFNRTPKPQKCAAVASVSQVQIRVGSPNGTVLATSAVGTGPFGYVRTPYNVTNGSTFFLQDISSGSPGVTIASFTIHPY